MNFSENSQGFWFDKAECVVSINHFRRTVKSVVGCVHSVFQSSFGNGIWNSCFSFLYFRYVSDGLESHVTSSDVSFLIYRVK